MSEDIVLIAGGGPTGLMLACELTVMGVEAVILETRLEPPLWSRSQTFQVRSVETFRQRGLDWFDGYTKVRTYNFGMLELMGAIDPSLVPPRVPQRDIELKLEAHARQLGVDLRRGHTVTGLQQDEHGVTATVLGPDGEYEISGRYLVGADGGRSTVRKLAQTPFDGGPSPFTFTGLTGDVRLEVAPPEEYRIGPDAYRIGPAIFPQGVFLLLPQLPEHPGVHRLTVMHFDVPAPPADDPVTTDEVEWSIKELTGIELKLSQQHLLSRFGGATLLARTYRQGRVFLAGDSAHVHMPFGGQGLNTGVQDAVNLGWKLAAEMQGWAPAGLLDSYHTERRPVGEQVCMNTKAQLGLLYPLERLAPLLGIMRDLMKFDKVTNHIFEMISAVGLKYPITYPDGPAGPRDHDLLGRRLPPVDLTTGEGRKNVADLLTPGRGVLLDLTTNRSTGAVAAGWADRVELVDAEPADSIEAAVVLVRPDGYVAWADRTGEDQFGLELALRQWFGSPTGDGLNRPATISEGALT